MTNLKATDERNPVSAPDAHETEQSRSVAFQMAGNSIPHCRIGKITIKPSPWIGSRRKDALAAYLATTARLMGEVRRG